MTVPYLTTTLGCSGPCLLPYILFGRFLYTYAATIYFYLLYMLLPLRMAADHMPCLLDFWVLSSVAPKMVLVLAVFLLVLR
jgi:hypothetical protein